jgi:hypothetical protein
MEIENVCALIKDMETLDFFYGLLIKYGQHIHSHDFRFREYEQYNYLSCNEGVWGMYGNSNKTIISTDELELLIVNEA